MLDFLRNELHCRDVPVINTQLECIEAVSAATTRVDNGYGFPEALKYTRCGRSYA